MLPVVLFIKLTKIVLDKTQLRPIMGIWVNAILIHINMKLNIPITTTNVFKVDFLFNFLEVCEAKFLQESPEVSKYLHWPELKMC